TELRDWKQSPRVAPRSKAPRTEPDDDLPPDESLDASFQRYRESVQSEVLDRIKAMPPEFFEGLVVDLLLRLGYGGPFGSGLTLGRSGDRGVDGVIHQDKL